MGRALKINEEMNKAVGDRAARRRRLYLMPVVSGPASSRDQGPPQTPAAPAGRLTPGAPGPFPWRREERGRSDPRAPPRPPRPAPAARPGGGSASSRGPVSSRKETRPSGKWHITNFALGSRARLRPLSKGGEGEAALKAAAAPLPEPPRLRACSRTAGSGVGGLGGRGQGAWAAPGEAASRGAAPRPGPSRPRGSSPNASSGKRMLSDRQGSSPPRPPPGAPRSSPPTPRVGKPRGSESPGRRGAAQVPSRPPAYFRVTGSRFT